MKKKSINIFGIFTGLIVIYYLTVSIGQICLDTVCQIIRFLGNELYIQHINKP